MDTSSTPSRPPRATSGNFLRLGTLLRRQSSAQPRRPHNQLVLSQQTLPPPASSTPNNLDMEKSSYTTTAMAQEIRSSGGKEEEGGGKGKRVGIWMAGENRGASMKLQRAPKELLVGSKSSSTKHEEEEEEEEEKEEEEELPVMVVVNSNVQSVNSSVVIDSTCKEKSPGVHIVVSGAGGLFFPGRS